MTLIAIAHVLESVGLVLIAVLIAGWLLGSSDRLRWISAVLVLGLTPLVLAGSVVGDEQSSLPQLSAPLIGAGLVGGAIALAVAAAFFVKFPRAVMPVALATIAFRVPIEIGGDSVKLLLPLYLTIGGAVVARAWLYWRGRAVDAPRGPKLLDLTIVAFLGLYAVQSLYAGDVSVATQNFCFFYAPFVLLYGLAASQKWDAKLLRTCAATLVIVALVLVFAGFIESVRQRYLITIGGSQGSDFDPYFRVQSFFFDPNIYGRFLAIVMLVVTALMLYTEKMRRVLGAAVILAVLWAGLVLSLSQSSFAALLSGLVVLAALRWKAKPVLVFTGVVLLAGVVFAVAFPSVTGVELTNSKSAEKTTSGRFDLVTGGLTLWGQKPFFGHGSGDFSESYRANKLAKRTVYGPASTTKSHTAPLTVAAEQGIVGLAAFIAFLVAGFGAVFRRVSKEDGPRGRPGLVARVAVAAAFTAIFVHSLAYAALLEDPLMWALLGAAVSLAAIPRNGATEEPAETEPS
ncbi:MAG: O-antigen ligase family protein [Thermoleophilaceae bacterium]|nr:O-antigen ligase family protein [Thermoleophilaceae bacterium]